MKFHNITQKQQVKNFAFSQSKPFSISYLASATELKEKTVRKYLNEFEKTGFIKRVNGRNKIYYILNRPPRNKAGPKRRENKHYCYPISKKTLEIFRKAKAEFHGEVDIIGRMMNATGYTRRTIVRYLKVM